MSVFYGWKISGLSMAGNFLLQGGTVYAMNAFMEPLCDAYGWSRMGLNFSLGLSAIAGQIAMPIAAAISAKVSLRFLMGCGALAGGAATCGMGLTSNLTLFTILMIIVWVSAQFCGGVVGNALMSNWFYHYRGIAFGLANSGTSLSGIVIPFLALLIIHHFSVGSAYLAMGFATMFLAPLCWTLVRGAPEMMHLTPDGLKQTQKKATTAPKPAKLKNLIKQPAPWAIGISYGLGLMVGSGILSQLKPRYSDLGVDAYTGMLFLSLAAVVATIAKYVWGWICDVTNPIIASRLLFGGMFLSIFLIFLPQTLWTLGIFGMAFSCASGGLWVVLPAVVTYYFGGENFLGVYKFVSIFILLRSLGFPIMGVSFEFFDSYVMADLVFSASLLTAFFLTFILRTEFAAENQANKNKE